MKASDLQIGCRVGLLTSKLDSRGAFSVACAVKPILAMGCQLPTAGTSDGNTGLNCQPSVTLRVNSRPGATSCPDRVHRWTMDPHQHSVDSRVWLSSAARKCDQDA